MAVDRLAINNAKVVYEIIEDEVIIINLDTGMYYNLIGTGLDTWRALELGVPRETLVTTLASHYGADSTTVADAVSAFLDDLASEDIVVVAPDGDQPTATFEPSGRPDGASFPAPTLFRHSDMSDLLMLDPIHDVDEQGWPNARTT